MASKRKNTKKKQVSTWAVIIEQIRLLLQRLLALAKNPKTHRVAGVTCWFLCVCFTLAFISYILHTWNIDQSYVQDAPLSQIIGDTHIKTQNWFGRLGSYLSHLFIYKWFGLAAFGSVFVLWKTGRWFLQKKVNYHLGEVYRHSALLVVIACTTLSYCAWTSDFPWGGGLGRYVAGFLMGFIGELGTLLVLITTIFFTIKWLFDVDLQKWLQKDFSKLGTGKFLSFFATKKVKPARAGVPKASSKTEKTPLYKEGVQVDLDFQQPQASTKPKKKVVLDPSEHLLETVDLQHTTTAIEREEELPDIAIGDTTLEPYNPRLDLSTYGAPEIDLLDKYGSDLYGEERLAVSREELERNKVQIVETLRNYNIEISKISATPGPTVTLYQIVPAPGVRISKIRNLEDDIALSLAALGIRIIAPMPGKGTIGIEVPNQNKEIVSLRSILRSDKFQKAKMVLPIGLGKTIAGDPFVADLSKMPHLLLAGATGQGKSVCLNSILVSLLYKKHPAELKFVMIDPKKVELSLYNVIEKHFMAKLPDEEEAIVTDIKKVINTLNALCIEMDQRYDLLKKAYVRNIREYNAKFTKRKLNPEKGHRFLPYFVLVIDEFADLIMTAGKEVELPLARLAQLARAIGIHLVIATQRPTVNIITGTIKANFPCRIAFRVTSKVDSRTILDQGGANQLIGRGDMLLSIGGELIRLQGAFVDTPEVERIAEYIGMQKSYNQAFMLPEYRDDKDTSSSTNKGMVFDDLFEDAAHVIVQHQQGSTSLIQRKLRLGYNRAGRIMDQLEAVGIVGPNAGSKARDVYILDSLSLEELLQRLRSQ